MNRLIKRWILRLSLLLVIVAGVIGGWIGAGAWQIDLDAMSSLDTGDSGDWVDWVAAIAEEAIQLFFGFTSGQ